MDEERDSKEVRAAGEQLMSIADLLEEKEILIASLREHRELLIRIVDRLAPRGMEHDLVRAVRALLKP
jgi:hypothetical protein